ncbi:MAG: hypothetical protein CSA62_12295 [Planctomycetota bacterium]|nr:MAG: hypothetical protein CSA62_12295 [Planctomycetota bacterium]
MALVVIGVGFLVFVHELGHFLAARAAGVYVEVFSIGFGTRLFGWRDRKGTDWRICLVPIGGYVKMYGEAPGEGDPEDDRALSNKSVPWRLLIFSGGVLMNVLFAAVAFPIVLGVGIPFNAPVAGEIAPGSPAAIAGVQQGDRFLTVNGSELHSFRTLQTEAALSGEEGLVLGIERKQEGGGSKQIELTVHPRYRPSIGLKVLGISAPLEDSIRAQLHPGSTAAEAGLPARARLIELNGEPVNTKSWVELTRKLRGEKAVRFVANPISVGIIDEEGVEATIEYKPTLDPGRPVLGVTAPEHAVLQVAAPEALGGLELKVGDILVSLILGEQRHFVAGLGQLQELLRKAEPRRCFFELRRRSKPDTALDMRKLLRLELPSLFLGPKGRPLDGLLTLGNAPMVSNYVLVQEGSAAADAGLRSGDRILSLDTAPVNSFETLAELVRKAKGKALQVRWQPFQAKDGTSPQREAEITPRKIPVVDFGFTAFAEPLRETYRIDGVGASMYAGAKHCVETIRQLYATLKRIFGGSVAADNLGGIITIGVATYEKARSGFMELLFFLAILSLNLAFINVLPIPVLDGGHLMFLLVEAIKGSPVSTRVMSYAQFVGLMLVLALMVYVIFNDLVRHVF